MPEDKVLVTGACGFIGRRVCRLLHEWDVPFAALDSLPRQTALCRLSAVLPAESRNLDIVVVEADITSLDEIDSALAQLDGVYRIIHLASLLTAEVEENLSAAVSVNVLGTANLLEVCARRGVERIVMASSEAVYGNGQHHYGNKAVVEDDYCPPLKHHYAYGPMKLLNEFIGSKYASERGLGVACLRPSVVFGYGRGGGGQSWAEIFGSNPAVGKPARLPFPGSNRECWIYVDDCAEQIVRLALKPQLSHYVYNSGGETVSAAEQVSLVKRYLPDADIYFDDGLAHTPLVNEVDGSRLVGEIGFRPRPFAQGLLAHINEARLDAGLEPIEDNT